MARRGCSFGRRKNGRCPARKSGRGLSGYTRTCVRYLRVGTGANSYLRCSSFVQRRGVPVFRGQRHGFAQGTLRSRDRSLSHDRL